MGSRSVPEWMIYVVAAFLVLPALVPVGFSLMGNLDAALAAIMVICAAFPIQAAGVLLLILTR